MSTFNVKTIKPTNGFRYRVQPKKKKPIWLYLILAIIAVAVLFVLFTKILPSVEVVVVPVTEDLEKEFNVRLTIDGSDVNESENIFLAEVLEVDDEANQEFKATGEKDVGDKAQGKVTFYNSTGRPQPLTNKINLITDSGETIVVKDTVTIPGAKVDDRGNVVPGVITVDVEALEPGEKGNAASGRVNISALVLDMQEKIYGQISVALAGGNSKKVQVVSQEDLDNAKDELVNLMEPGIKEKLEKKAADNFVVSDDLIFYEVTNVSTQVEVNSEVEKFDLNVKLKAKAFLYDNMNLRLKLRDKILTELPASQTISETEFGNLTITINESDPQIGLADLTVKAVFPVSQDIDLQSIKSEILGKSEKEARRYILSLPNVKDVRFVFLFSFTNKIPSKQNKIKLTLGQI